MNAIVIRNDFLKRNVEAKNIKASKGFLCFHKPIGNEKKWKWVITHIPSGRVVAFFDNLNTLHKIAKELCKIEELLDQYPQSSGGIIKLQYRRILGRNLLLNNFRICGV